jgi:hypothetical protein
MVCLLTSDAITRARAGPYPLQSRSSEIRLDICAMSTEGGCESSSGKPLATHTCERNIETDAHVDMGRLMSVGFSTKANGMVVVVVVVMMQLLTLSRYLSI